MSRFISLVIPALNEEKNITTIINAVRHAVDELPQYQFEVIFVNDGSTDGTAREIAACAAHDQRIKCVEFSRNFNKEIAITAGLHYAQGDAAIIMDADLQHPPELIPEFIAAWERGGEMVIGVRDELIGAGMIKKIGSHLFFRVMRLFGDVNFLSGETDFRLIDRKLITVFNTCSERRRIARGLLDWLGFKKEYIHFIAPERTNGVAKYSGKKLFALAGAALVAHSMFPLHLAGYLGASITALSGILGLFVVIDMFFLADPLQLKITGTAMLAIMILFLVGIILICIGLMALYISHLQESVANRPLYVIRSTINL
ncbi:MAG: hypothetical protein A2848_02260 [Candidatus Magasanikbacteria bacterium RIFCSPHIGHO2_01_FULL_50_8]|uniref:Glycosyltransferase 2-like domain-containing protein n=2 Tax=Candidatus Magasanikiibacteriota TaxID=1752731 RepID=A0A1F6LP03_9BACT|nr:MAG: hypothetical protein A2848_02260 [Candidatus Magasanikbacteria bacterium RIFCSPHIGHO2_01_FULL_50_8]OGH67710.1 MAG: hypothetical protein A3C15_01550 [Candidatus Magasanikbacteria bacterium RIFCSPHIGHO2_02_FULL_50_9b]